MSGSLGALCGAQGDIEYVGESAPSRVGDQGRGAVTKKIECLALRANDTARQIFVRLRAETGDR